MISRVKLVSPLFIQQNNIYMLNGLPGPDQKEADFAITLDNPRQRFHVKARSGEEYYVPMVNVSFYQEKKDEVGEKQ